MGLYGELLQVVTDTVVLWNVQVMVDTGSEGCENKKTRIRQQLIMYCLSWYSSEAAGLPSKRKLLLLSFIRYQFFLPWLPSRNIINFTHLTIARINRPSSTRQQPQIWHAVIQIYLVRTFLLWKRHHSNIDFHNTHWFNYSAILCLNLSHKPSLCWSFCCVVSVCLFV